MGLRFAIPVILVILTAASAAPAEPDVHVVEGARYRLTWNGNEAQAKDMSKLLEAAWKPFRAFFGAEPRLRKGKRLDVKFYGTRETWLAGIRADNAVPPRSGGGYYSPRTKTAYIYRQPTPYYTRCLVIHEVCHQFHYLACTGNVGPKALWYLEGVVEHLCWHTWDGESLELGVLPISIKNYPAAALKALEDGEMDLKTLVEGKLHRALGAMLVRFLYEGEKGRLRRTFRKLAKKLDRGAESLSAFKSCFGNPQALQPRFLAWLIGAQEPWSSDFHRWELVGPGRILGTAKVLTHTRLRYPARSLKGTLDIPASGTWHAGVLLHYQDRKNLTLALASNRNFIEVRRKKGGAWTRLARETCPKPKTPGSLRFQARREGSLVHLEVEGEAFGPFELPGATFGLALDRCTVRFRDLEWTAVE
jgi:hypothetical protein